MILRGYWCRLPSSSIVQRLSGVITCRNAVVAAALAVVSVWLLVLTGCGRAVEKPPYELPATVVLLDSLPASSALTQDNREFFFDQVGAADMALQMGIYPSGLSRATLLSLYRRFLQSETLPFSVTESDFISKCMEEALQLAAPFLQHVALPDSIALIKTRGRQYGPGVYYTRENRIVIPADALRDADRYLVREVLLHELFHLLSRYNPVLRERLYRSIGFHPLDAALRLPPELEALRLSNPDGINCAYAIRLGAAPGQTIRAVPLITIRPDSKGPYYFNYLHFDLYPVSGDSLTGYAVQLALPGGVPLREHPDFVRQAGSVTDYNIHPDEILAEHFKYLALERAGLAGRRFSVQDKRFLSALEIVLLQKSDASR